MRRSALLLCSLVVSIACGGAKDETPKPDAAAAQAAKPAGDAVEAPAEAAPAEAKAAPATAEKGTLVIDHRVQDIDGNEVSLADYRGKALLIVNTASECGFTPQYAQLQKLYESYADKGFEVLAFPSNDFGGQEPGSHEEIKKFVAEEYGVKFPLFAKVATKGEGQAPLYGSLTTETPEHMRGDVKWNFTKFLVSPEGEVVARFESPVDPMAPELREAIEAVLPADAAAGTPG